MSAKRKAEKLAAPVFGFDRRARKALLPYRDHPLAKGLSWFSQAGDQLQLRLLSGGVLLLGLARRDSSLVRASLRMALAHEMGTFTKDQLKERVIRSRPRSASGKPVKPRKGHDTAKEESSFPSGHAGGAFAAAGGFAAEFPAYAGWSHGAAAAIGLARLPRNAHYPTDIVAGALVGAVSAALVNALWAVASRTLRPAR
ncbi:phosphatase PAP2 family protein [Tsuneonella sp. HG249]